MTTSDTLNTAPQIVHFAVRVKDVDSAAKFYTSAFRLRELARLNVKNLTAVHTPDGIVAELCPPNYFRDRFAPEKRS